MSTAIAKQNSRNVLTEGPVLRKLLGFAIPTILGNLCMQLYNVVDSVVVGNFVGTQALAAVGASFSLMMLFNALFMGVSMGSQIVVSQTFGAKNYKQLRKVINTAISLAFIIGGAITIIGAPLSGPLLRLLGTPEDIFVQARDYLLIIFLGTLGNVFFNFGAGALRGQGDSRWPLIAQIVSSVLNIGLDLFFVLVLDWGVVGVALATSIAHFASGMVLLVRIQTGGYAAKVYVKDLLHPDGECAKRIFSLGLPSAIQNAAMSVGSVIIQSFANSFGSEFIAANAIVTKADGFAMMPMMGLGQATTSFVGQNIGAGKMDRAKKGVHTGMLTVIVIAAVMGVILYITGPYIMMAFGAAGNVLFMGVSGIHFLAFCYAFIGFDHVVGGSMRGAGVAIAPACTSIASNLCRIPIAYFLAARPLRKAIAALIEKMPPELVTKANEYMSTGAYADIEAAQQAAAANICSLDHFMGMFYSMGASLFIGAALICAYYKFGKWHNRALKSTAHANKGMEKPQEEA
ncbi:MAG: MATE family efflux transporter [Ruminococcaceae bacterium]|nr:MATE family efflux transporter [Oscillospiraceae bacterium]